MVMSLQFPVSCFCLSLFVLAPISSQASLEDARESLLQRSPFVKWSPPRQEATPPPAPVVETGALSRELQFNGIMQIGDETYFNIFDKIENRSTLLGVDEDNGGRFKVVGYNASGDRSITVQAGGGRQEKIMLATSDGVSIPTQTPTPNAANNQPNIRRTPNRPEVQRRTAPITERRRRVIPRRINTNRE